MMTTETRMQEYISMNEYANRLGIDRQTAFRWAWSGILKTTKIGGRRVVPLDALELPQEDTHGQRCIDAVRQA